MYKIEKNIPIQQKVAAKYPFDEMSFGDSFFVPCTKDVQQIAQRIRASAYRFGRINECRFTIREVKGGVRVWKM